MLSAISCLSVLNLLLLWGEGLAGVSRFGSRRGSPIGLQRVFFYRLAAFELSIVLPRAEFNLGIGEPQK